ncbi:hypothetical protein PoB_004786400 [Plakobranchus ocellatus]|uniref:Uncharacterized protein n=1 Tax=Plakobranchus ocellatus TaxID=259542 RepID=A0AAV4BSJ6_9GAST|nr:hypothetical protein PoB_004786400 [Plakobranchus ocellatus]
MCVPHGCGQVVLKEAEVEVRDLRMLRMIAEGVDMPGTYEAWAPNIAPLVMSSRCIPVRAIDHPKRCYLNL